MEPCSTPSYKTAAKPVCGCATASSPVPSLATAPDMYAIEFYPRPIDESVPLAVPLLAAAFAVFVLVRQRRPSRIVVLGVFRPEETSRRFGFAWPRLELSGGERRFFARLGDLLRGLRPTRVMPATAALAYSQPRFRNQ